MRYWVANTDLGWYSYLAALAPLDEVNFWQPNTVRPVTSPEGGLWLFKLHNRAGGWIVGGGYLAHYTTLTPRFGWGAFGLVNGSPTFDDFVRRLSQYSQRPIDVDSTLIGSSVLVEPFFLEDGLVDHPQREGGPDRGSQATIGEPPPDGRCIPLAARCSRTRRHARNHPSDCSATGLLDSRRTSLGRSSQGSTS